MYYFYSMMWNVLELALPYTLDIPEVLIPSYLIQDADVYKPKPSGYCIRVVVTEINPQAYYKTLEINHHTTAFEVIVKLIRKYALKDEDRDPNDFYLTEVSDTY